jgi:hypothetical protein
VCNVALGCNAWLRDIPHVFLYGVYVAYVAGGVATAVLCEVTRFPTIKAGSFGSGVAVVLLWFGGCCIVIGVTVLLLCVRSVSVGIVASVLPAVIGHSAMR